MESKIGDQTERPTPITDALDDGAITAEDGEAVAEMLATPSDTPTAHRTRPCESCDHRGVTDYDDRKAVYCDCDHGRRKHYEHFQRIHDRFPRSGVPDHLQGVTLESLRERAGGEVMNVEAVQATRRVLEGVPAFDPEHGTRHSSLCILGANGLGKTGLLTILARSAYVDGFTPLFIKYADLYSAVQSGYGTYVDGDPRHELSQIRTETAQRVHTLCLDDLGDPFGDPTDYQVPKDRRDILFRVLSARHERGRDTHITANYESLGDVAHQFDPRIADRIKEMCAVVEMDGPNLREISS